MQPMVKSALQTPMNFKDDWWMLIQLWNSWNPLKVIIHGCDQSFFLKSPFFDLFWWRKKATDQTHPHTWKILFLSTRYWTPAGTQVKRWLWWLMVLQATNRHRSSQHNLNRSECTGNPNSRRQKNATFIAQKTSLLHKQAPFPVPCLLTRG